MESQKKEFGAIILSPSCQNKCVFCGQNPGVSMKELRDQETKIIRTIKDLQNDGTGKIEISGGDPIEYYEILQLIKYLKSIGFKLVQLSTHGRKLSDDNFLKGFANSGIDRLRVPIYGSNAEIHDAVTRGPGSFEETVGGLRKLTKLNHKIYLQLFTLIVQQNKDDLTELVDLAYSLNPQDFYIAIPCVSNGDYSYYVPIKDLSPYVKKIVDHCEKKTYQIRFMEMPYCVFGRKDIPLDNTGQPPNLGKYFQPQMKSGIKDLPSYRVKTQVGMCKECVCTGYCDGFFVNDVSVYGTGNLKPIK